MTDAKSIRASEKQGALTLKQESFCQAYVETGNASEAYREAYPRSKKWKPEAVNVAASKMLGNDKVSVRVEELKSRHLYRHDLTVDDLVSDLLRIRQKAETDGQLGVARQSVMDVAKLLGLVVDKEESKIQMSGQLTTEKAVMILQSLGINPEINQEAHNGKH